MKTLTFTHVHDLAQLNDELLAAIPSLLGVSRLEGPSSGARVKSPEYLSWLDNGAEGDAPEQYVVLPADDADTVRLFVPDDTDEEAITTVIQAHTPAPRRERSDEEYAAEWPKATAARRQTILAIKTGLLPREEVPA